MVEGGRTPTAWIKAGHRLTDQASWPWNTTRHAENTWAGPLRCSFSAKGPGMAAGSQQSCCEQRIDWSAGECSELFPPDFSELRFAAQPTGRVLDCIPTTKPRITTSSCFLPFNFSENCPTYSTNQSSLPVLGKLYYLPFYPKTVRTGISEFPQINGAAEQESPDSSATAGGEGGKVRAHHAYFCGRFFKRVGNNNKKQV